MIRGLRAKLTRAMKQRTLVRVERPSLESGWSDGYVVAAGAEWFVLHYIAEVDFAGYQALRLRDVSKLTVPAPYAEFVEKVLRKLRHRRVVPKCVDATSTAALIQFAGDRFPVITLHTERKRKGVCFIGKLVAITNKDVVLHDIAPGAKWDLETTSRPIAAITRIDFDGPYERALVLVAGKPPRIT